MGTNPFKKAERKRSFLNVAITGPSGSGKTWSALEIATGMGGKIAVADTENGSAALYSQYFDFDHLNINPPFTQEKYIRAVKAAYENGYDILIIDSFTHVWAGEGGVQDQKDALDEGGGSKWANWKKPKALHRKVKDAILHSQIHVIATIRSKQGYVQSEEGSKSKVIKVGMDPIAEPGIEYEFTVVFDMDMAHNAIASKDRTALFSDGLPFRPTKATGAALMAWRNDAKEAEQSPAEPNVEVPPRQKAAAPAAMQAPARKSQKVEPEPELKHMTLEADPGAWFVSVGFLAKAKKTIREIYNEQGLDVLTRSADHFRSSPREDARKFVLAVDLFAKQVQSAAPAEEESLSLELEAGDAAASGVEADWSREEWPGDR